LRFMRQDVIYWPRRSGPPWGYQRQAASWPRNVQGVQVVGEKSVKFVGVEFYELPSQVVQVQARPIVPAGRAAPIVPPGLALQPQFGVRALAIGWWLIVLASALVPVYWGYSAVVWWRRISKEDRKSAKRCLVCGYDIRATPGRCPECGEISSEVTSKTSWRGKMVR